MWASSTTIGLVEFQNRGGPIVYAILWASLTHEDAVYSGNQLCDLVGSVCVSSQPTESVDAEQAGLLGRNKAHGNVG